ALRGDPPARPPVEVLVHVDATTLTGRGERAGISAETARRLLCDAGIVPILEDAHATPLDVGRKTRSIPTALRRALRTRDVGCRFPGCTHTRYVDAHHLPHWVDGGATSLANTALLCTRHHTLVHEGGFRVTADGEGLRFFDPRGAELPSAGTPPAVRMTQLSLPAPAACGLSDLVDYSAAVE